MEQLDDDQLVKSYYDALRYKLDNQFLDMLKKEIKKRNLIISMDAEVSIYA